MDLAARLKAARKAAGLTQEDLANVVTAMPGVTSFRQQSVSGLENGTVKQTRYLVQLAIALRVRPEWLRTGDGPQELFPADLTDDEHSLVTAYRNLPASKKAAVRALLAPTN